MGNEMGKRIRELLENQGYKQNELAEKIHVTESSLSHYIKGDRVPRSAVLARLAAALGTTSEYLMYGDMIGQEREIEQAKRLIARNVAHMTPEDKRDIINYLIDL